MTSTVFTQLRSITIQVLGEDDAFGVEEVGDDRVAELEFEVVGWERRRFGGGGWRMSGARRASVRLGCGRVRGPVCGGRLGLRLRLRCGLQWRLCAGLARRRRRGGARGGRREVEQLARHLAALVVHLVEHGALRRGREREHVAHVAAHGAPALDAQERGVDAHRGARLPHAAHVVGRETLHKRHPRVELPAHLHVEIGRLAQTRQHPRQRGVQARLLRDARLEHKPRHRLVASAHCLLPRCSTQHTHDSIHTHTHTAHTRTHSIRFAWLHEEDWDRAQVMQWFAQALLLLLVTFIDKKTVYSEIKHSSMTNSNRVP